MNTLDNIRKVYHNLNVTDPFRIFHGYSGKARESFNGDSHYDFQMCLILSGAQEILYSDYKTEVMPGQVWWTSCWEPHAVRPSRNYTIYLVVTLSLEALGNPDFCREVDWFRPFFLPPQLRPQPVERHTRKKVHDFGREIIRLEKEKPYGYHVLQWLKIHELIIFMISNASSRE